MPSKPLRSHAQDMVFNFKEYFALDKENGGPLISLNAIKQRVADALGETRQTVSKIETRKERLGVLPSPTKSRPNRKPPKTRDLPKPIKMEIRSTIYDMCKNSRFKKSHRYSFVITTVV
ncbi:uncharacterized protein LOC135127423 [Zophobas morio]|uniref:uncharacterized protein LOC135127423 n=1 Tax=Zophobas morio TaxID=2755281 RepID=UPI003082741B